MLTGLLMPNRFVVVEFRDLPTIDDCYVTVKYQVRSSLGETSMQIQVVTYQA